ncbi:protein SRC2 homolog [Syzygium oleosum]|uniref:protein SRC2 homolog n=1 Tax=Syzygium oleosum TaxID=219896 RepID=UPI0011D1D988|nr:protein SRC2 homolog [Syzygium oleosum]
MECRRLYVTMTSASGLMTVRRYLTMHPYVVASLSGDEGHNNEQRTPAHRDGGTSPRWDHAFPPFTVDVAAARAGLLTLKLEIKTERTLKSDKDVGWVDVPVEELLEQGGDGESRAMSYAVRLKSGGTRGVLEFSYRFGESFTVREGAPYQPPANQQPPGAGRAGGGLLSGMVMGNAISDFFGDGLDM